MKKILFVATVAEHFYYFHLPCFKFFKENGWRVDVACHGERELPFCDNKYEITIKRSPSDFENFSAYRQLKNIIKKEHYDIIHCHTPMGGVLARLAAKGERKNGTSVIYTAHGFHFYKGAPFLNWAVYYPIEKLMSALSDCIITINDEDFLFAKKHLNAKQTVRINGVGYNSDLFYKISENEKKELRKKKGYNLDEKILIYVAELNANKNQGMLLHALKLVLQSEKNVRLLLVGADNFNGKYQRLVKELEIMDNVDFLGHREDVCDLVHISDVVVGSSIREGLPVNVMEAMACGLPCVLSDNRGNRTLCENSVNGFVVAQNDNEAMAEKICQIINDDETYSVMSNNTIMLVEKYSKENVLCELKKIYKIFM